MRGFEDIGSKGHFSAKKGGFWAKKPMGGKREFFSKIRLEHFFSLAKMQLCTKFQKNLMRGSPDIASRTHGRTHAGTKERESIGPSANAERPKITIFRGFLTFGSGLKAPRGSKQLFGVKITSKMKSAPSNYSECKFSAKFDNFS